MSQQEQFGFRCEEISQRHRLWGRNLAAVDLDFTLLHYHHEKPVALVEFKFKMNTQFFDESNPSIRALAHLADAAGLPLFLVRYVPDVWIFYVSPGNELARNFTPARGQQITEREFITLLYRVRGEPVPPGLLEILKGSPAEEYGYIAEPIVFSEKITSPVGQDAPKNSIKE